MGRADTPLQGRKDPIPPALLTVVMGQKLECASAFLDRLPNFAYKDVASSESKSAASERFLDVANEPELARCFGRRKAMQQLSLADQIENAPHHSWLSEEAYKVYAVPIPAQH